MENLYHFYNLLIIISELGVILIVFLVLHWAINLLFKKSYNLSWLKDKKSQLNNIRKVSKRILAFSWLVLSLAIIVFNVFLIYRGEHNLPQYTLNLFQNIPKQLWKTILYGLFITGGLIIITLTIIRSLDCILDQAGKRIKDFAIFSKLTYSLSV